MEEENAKAQAMGMSILSPQLQEKSEQAAADFEAHKPVDEDTVLHGLTLEDALAQAFEHADRINTSGYPAGKKPPVVTEPAD